MFCVVMKQIVTASRNSAVMNIYEMDIQMLSDVLKVHGKCVPCYGHFAAFVPVKWHT